MYPEENRLAIYRETKIRMRADHFLETIQAKTQWKISLK